MDRRFATVAFAAFCAGCPVDLGLNHERPYVHLYDTGSALRIVGCTDGALLGCNLPAAGATMSATADGKTLELTLGSDIPETEPTGIGFLDLGLDSGSGNDFELEIGSPTSPMLAFASGSAVASATEAPAFSVAAPENITRSRAGHAHVAGSRGGRRHVRVRRQHV